MRCNLMLHAGAHAAAREQVNAVATPAPTDTWHPLPHAQLLDGVEGRLTASGLAVVGAAHGLTRDGARYFGLLQVAYGTDGATEDGGDFGLVVGVRNSHDKSFPAALCLGASVFVCDNLSFSGEVKLARKHTRNIVRDLPGLIERAVGSLGDLAITQTARFDAYQDEWLSNTKAHDLIIRAVDARVLPITRIPDVLEQWRTPAHPEFKARTAWSLFNGFTEVLRGRGTIDELPRRTQALHGIFDAACGLVVRRQEDVIDLAVGVLTPPRYYGKS